MPCISKITIGQKQWLILRNDKFLIICMNRFNQCYLDCNHIGNSVPFIHGTWIERIFIDKSVFLIHLISIIRVLFLHS